MNSFRWGLIGPGRIANQFANALKADFVGELYAVASRDIKRAETFANTYHATRSYDNYQDLIADKNVDAIYIATPHNFHYEQVKQCLLAKKSVLCEKPLTVTFKQATELTELAKQQNVFLMEAMWSLYLPIYQQVNEWIKAGKIGDITLVQSNFGIAMPRNESDRWLNPELAGGATLDLGVYCVATAQWFIGSYPEKIQASGLIGSTGVDELAMANLSYPNQKHAQINCTLLSWTDNSIYINGTKGRIKIHDMFWAATTASLITGNTTETVTLEHAVNGFEYEIAEAERCIKAGKIESDVVSHQVTRQNMHIMETILEQIAV